MSTESGELGGRRWRLAVEHTTVFSYDAPVRLSYNETRLLPTDDIHQRTVSASVTTTPGAHQQRYNDYWGTRVVAFDVPDAHSVLEIRLDAVIDTAAEAPSRAYEEHIAWTDLRSRTGFIDEFLEATPYTKANGELAEAASSLRMSSPAETVTAVATWVNNTIEYEKGVTSVHTSAAEALEAGKGVCQDLAHLTIAALRPLGIPARYVSGYLHPTVEPVLGDAVLGQSHAWVEAWTGGWWAVDPTNLLPTGPRHVVVARGRDYADVAPVRGIYAGSARSSMSTVVTVTRIA